MRRCSILRKGVGAERPSGFTLVEVVIALVLVAVGLLALSATSARVTRDVGTASDRVAAALTARNRVEWLVATPCALLDGGSAAHAHGVREWWVIERVGSAALLRDSVMIAVPGGVRSIVLRSSRPC